ncbi:type I restriction enzyme HsdR N-terminal domain-containing protein [Aquirufa aurantiipilula]|uniref:type I restriction enzyme HsdR N-terminal domain-containing protein n=1 Tax=Aquirufa aurantiipilula TaxID=2696561 RepID=UPI001CAA6641|nr:type I restriction enzyme HsdR N-terminal domain-containing protein [Aquirufa aurantiipilula]MBZ1327646.1 type I restriction enzyme HsdR N-terminal domain-containing protein [Aquirufa aurantiipilula]
MTELEILKQLKQKFGEINLNEADTRFKIIDTIIVDILKWPKDTILTEKYIDGNRADYVLKDRNDRPLIIIESKKNSEYFELPKTFNSKEPFQKIILEKLLTDDVIKNAISQVKEYAEDLFCNFAAICNGEVWIIFRIHSHHKPWKKLPAYVIKNLNYFEKNLTEATNLLGYYAVNNLDSLNTNIGVSKKTYSEIFYPKNNITTFNTPVNSNNYAGPLKTISLKYLGPIPETDKDFMDSCYVTNKGLNDSLQKDMQGFLHDSLTPYFKNLGFRDFSDDKRGGALGFRITEIIKKEKLNNVMILFGGRGAGKSTFIKRFLYHTQPIEIKMLSQVGLIALLYSAQTKERLSEEIWQKLLESIDISNLRNGSRDQILDLFSNEFDIFKKQILAELRETDNDYQKLIREFIQTNLKDTKLVCEKISLKWKDKNKALVIFIDNMDQLPPELQDVCFLTASEISDKLSCLVIVAMREERYAEASSRGVLDAYQSPGFHLSSPVITEVIIKRIEYIIDKITFTADIDSEFGIKDIKELNTLVAFLNICKNQLINKKSPLSYFLRYATHGDVRQALEFFKGFLTSGYTNINEMAAHSDWVFQVHQVVKPMMIPNRFFYDERSSKIPNLYQLRNDTDSSHFTGLRILNYLHNKAGDKGSNGFVDVKYLIHNFDVKYDSKTDCINNIDLFLEKGLIEANNRLEKFSEDVDQIKITALGNYIFKYLAFNFAYIDLISLDSGIYDESINNSFVKSAGKELQFYYERDFMSRIKLRIKRVREFIDYLCNIERQEFLDLGLDSTEINFSTKLKESIEIQIKKVLNSAENKEKILEEYN